MKLRTSTKIALTAAALIFGTAIASSHGSEAYMRPFPNNSAVRDVRRAAYQEAYHDNQRSIDFNLPTFGLKSDRLEFEFEQNGIIKYSERLSVEDRLSTGNGVIRVSIDGDDFVSKNKYLPIRNDFGNISLYEITKDKRGEKRTLVSQQRVFIRLSDELQTNIPVWTGPKVVVPQEIEIPRKYDPTIGQPDAETPKPAEEPKKQEPVKDSTSFIPIGM